ncbi:hypothetical protein HRI_001262700 [Hibiscus trionum]|uniref:Uncharacterized protein n=1 Tax=Hibiscus trionum TaxID=183268 RepID=A0A9W7LSV7_HIBTR|nr:hypothetical protein HRI_001262700 [Hibiscus trionum]
MGERMLKTALWCIQHRPNLRPLMSIVVKMLEGATKIPAPPNPFAAFWLESDASNKNNSTHTTWTDTTCDTGLSSIVADCATPVMKKYRIEMASS